MATKLFENISSVQNIPAATSDTPRDRYKPISLYLVGAGTGEWKVTVSYSPINSSVYKKLGPVFTLSVSNTNPFQLFSWDYDCDSFVAWVSEIKGNATATLWMTQGNARNLDYLLMTEPSARLKADPTDIPNCSLEYTPDGWVGNMGVFSTYGALLANPTNALVPGKVWAIVASASSFAKYNYMSAGWVLESSVGATGASNLPGSPSAPFPDAAARDAAYPSPSGQEVWMVNPCVPWGKSRMIGLSAGVWIVPAGEVLAEAWPSDANPVFEQTPGTTNLVFYSISPILPSYFVPDFQAFSLKVNAELFDSGTASYGASLIGIHFSGADINDTNDYQYQISSNASATNSTARLSQIPRDVVRSGSIMRHADGRDSQILNSGISSLKSVTLSTYNASGMRIRASVKTALTTTKFRVWGYLLVAQ